MPDAKHLAGLAQDQARTHALILVDPVGTVVGWMGGAEIILGYTADEIIGQNFSKLFTPEDQERGLDRLELQIARSSGESEDDRWQVRKDGARIWASGAVAPLYDESGNHLAFIKILRNRTDNKTHIEALEKRLSAMEKADKQKDTSISALAHDLRNPLSSLANAAQILELGNLPENLRPVIDIIRRQVDFMGRMVEDLLEVTRIAAGKVALQKQLVVLQELIEAAREACQPSIERGNHDFQVILPASPVHLLADRTRMCQVFINLIDNAVKYTPERGKIWVKVTVDGEDAVVKVQDTGIGIDPEMLDRVFDLFSQAKPAEATTGGLGIGLSVVKNIVTLHDGTVQVLSDGRGKGSEFIVRLPAAEPRANEPTPQNTAE